MAVTLSAGREWRSADGQRVIEAAFAGVRGDKVVLQSGGKSTAYPLAAFSADDQQFAKNAQFIADAAVKWGPQSFEITQIVDHGWLCRLALTGGPQNAPVLFTGETFFLVAADPADAKPGDEFRARLLYGAGGRTYHPLKGQATPIRAFALTAEEAARVWTETVAQSQGDAAKQSPPVIERDTVVTITRGMGLAVGKSGLVLIDSDLARDEASLVVHHNGGHLPARLMRTDDALGVSIISCGAPLEPARIGSRKPVEPGQAVLAVSIELNATKKSLAKSPAMTRGIVSRQADSKTGRFQHDAIVPPEALGGFIVGEKGDVAGVFFQQQSSARATAAGKTQAGSGSIAGLQTGISTQNLSTLLEREPGAGAPRASSGGADMEKLTKDLMQGVVLVLATRESKKPREIDVAKKNPSAGGPVTGWSLSKSGTRHNSKCRFYDSTKPCAATDGKPCKTCGG